MHYQESIQFYQYKRKKYILQFKIETSSYDRFKHTFKTDKYINIIQWEYILAKVNKVVVGVIKDGDDWLNKKNRFTTDDLIISYELVDKDEGLINYESINYEFDWIVKVTINKASTIQDSFNIQESQKSSSSPKKRFSSSSKESSAPNDEHDENVITGDTDDDDLYIHENKKAKIEDDDDLKLSVLQQSNRYNLKTRKDKGESGKQSSITSWITNRKEKAKPQKSKDSAPSTSKDALAQINKEKLQQMNDFVVRSEQEEQKKLERKNELKDYAILNCFDMQDSQIIQVIANLAYEIHVMFESDSTVLSTGKDAKINPCDITASNILSEKQTMLVLRTIEKLHKIDGEELNDNVLHDAALPRVIIELFKMHHGLKLEEAIERIKTQEEKKILFKEEFNESY